MVVLPAVVGSAGAESAGQVVHCCIEKRTSVEVVVDVHTQEPDDNGQAVVEEDDIHKQEWVAVDNESALLVESIVEWKFELKRGLGMGFGKKQHCRGQFQRSVADGSFVKNSTLLRQC